MINPLDLKPLIKTVFDDVWMAIQAERATLSYEDYLRRTDDPDYDAEMVDPEIQAIQQRITELELLAHYLMRYSENLQRWHH